MVYDTLKKYCRRNRLRICKIATVRNRLALFIYVFIYSILAFVYIFLALKLAPSPAVHLFSSFILYKGSLKAHTASSWVGLLVTLQLQFTSQTAEGSNFIIIIFFTNSFNAFCPLMHFLCYVSSCSVGLLSMESIKTTCTAQV